MKNNRRLQFLSVSCFSKSCKFFIAAAALAFLTAFAQAETITFSGGQTDSNAHSLADEGDTPAVTSSSGENKATGSLTLTGDSTFKIDSGSTLTVNKQMASNDYTSSRAITLYKTGAGTLKVDGKRVLVGNVYIKDGTLSLNFTDSGGSFLSNNIVTVDGASAVLDGAGAIINYAYRTGELNIINGGTVNNSKSDSHMTIPYPVYMNYGKMTATGSGATTYGNFILDNVIYVTGDTRNSIEASRVLLRNTGGEFNVYENAKLTINSNIFGDTVGLKKTGKGELSLTGVSSYTLTTEISAGTLALDAANAIVSTSSVINNGAITMSAAQQLNNLTGSGTINNGGKTLTLNNSTDSTFSGVISGSGAVTKTGSGELTLTKQNTVSGGVTVKNGTLTLAYAGPVGTFPKGSTITVDGSSAVLSGSGTVLGYGKDGAVGRLNLYNGGSINVTSGHITMGCVMYLNDGKFTITTPTDQGDSYGNYIIDNGIHAESGTSNAINANRISIRNDGHTESGGLFDVAENAMLTVNAVIFDSAIAKDKKPNVVKKGTGVLVFSAANTYSKDTTIEAGTIRLTGNGTLGSATTDITVTSSAENMYATLELAQTSGEINFTRNVKSNYYSNAATGGNQTGRLIKSGAATLNFSGNISSTGFETTAGVTNFGTEAAPNANGLRLGYLRVDNGATVNYNGGTNGTMTILAGSPSFAGKNGNGTWNINSGSIGTAGAVANLKLYIGGETSADKNSVGTVNIASGVTYNAGSQVIQVGSYGTGNLNIHGTMTSDAQIRLAEHTGSSGTIHIYSGGSLTNSSQLHIGAYGLGTVLIDQGATLTTSGSTYLGATDNTITGIGSMTVNGTYNASGLITVGSYGKGELTIENGGKLVSTTNIKLAEHSNQTGTITVKKGGSLKSQDLQVGSYGHGVVDNYGTIEITSVVRLCRDGGAGSGTLNVYKDATLTANIIYPGVTMPGTLNVNGGTVTTTNEIALLGRTNTATGTISITNGGSLTASRLQFGEDGTTYAVDTTLTLDDGTLSVVNVTYPHNANNKVKATVNLGKGTVITGAAPGVESIWWKSVHINLTSAEGTNFQVDAGKQALINSSMSGSGKLIKTGEGTLQINAAQGAVDIYSLVVSSGRLDMKEYFTGSLEVGLADADNSTVIFSPGNSVGSLEITGDFTLHSGATLLMEFDNTGTDSLTVLNSEGTGAGTATFEEGSIISLEMAPGTSISPNQQISFNLPDGIDFNNVILTYPSFLTTPQYNNGVLSTTVDSNAVPEPSTWALMILGAMGLLYWRKRK